MLGNICKKTVIALITAAIALSILLPVFYFVTISFASNYETYQFPARLFPSTSYDARFVYNDSGDDYSLFVKRQGEYESLKTDKTSKKFRTYLLNQLNVKMSEDEIDGILAQAKEQGSVSLTLSKDMLRNYEIFLILADGSMKALFNSLLAAGWTILISITLGGSAGYALARLRFKGRDAVNLSLMVVRMFPIVAISIPMIIYILKLNLYDTPLSLAIVYSVPNIALTAWITSSIFQGISVELEEASLVFGAGRLTTFMRITVPLAFPALVASSLYAFLAAWNDSITALIMTNENPTIALVVYRTVGSSTIANIPAAGAIVLLIPSLIFTFIIKNYINQLWGNVDVT